MPKCQNCHSAVLSDELIPDPSGINTCVDCAMPGLDYELSYSKKNGFKASARIGRAEINLHVPQEELTKVFG